jgi:hypothetical protein
MKTNTHNTLQSVLDVPNDGTRYIVILHDGRKVSAQWNDATARFYLDGEQSASVLRKEAFDWWPASA